MPYATASFVLRAVVRSRKTALRTRFAPDAAASTASHPNVRDDRDTPLVEGMRRGNYGADLGETGSGIFCGRAWTGEIGLIWFRKFVFWCSAPGVENAAWCLIVTRQPRLLWLVEAATLTMVHEPAGQPGWTSSQLANSVYDLASLDYKSPSTYPSSTLGAILSAHSHRQRDPSCPKTC